jgi:hypothetical protein
MAYVWMKKTKNMGKILECNLIDMARIHPPMVRAFPPSAI